MFADKTTDNPIVSYLKKIMKSIVRCLAFASIFIYFFVSVLTLPVYGVNWDEVSHATRGQAYLYYYLTGKTSYDPSLFSPGNRHSFYQMQGYNYAYQIKNDGDHPPLSDIIESFFNYIFYQKLGILGDFEAYHLYSVVLVAVFSILLYLWVEHIFGGIAGLVAILSLLTYPLWYGESHFNSAKDIPEAVYYSLTVLVFSFGYIRRSLRLILSAAVVFGLGLGTKLNIVFAVLALGIWMSILFFKEKIKRFISIRFAIISLIILFFVGGTIVYIGWPRLWFAGLKGMMQSLKYYKDIGTVSQQNKPSSYYLFGFSTYAIQWILYTTPLITLFFFSIGILKSIADRKNIWSLLIILWFLVPILRVSLPHTAIYGGVRQIMEYIPAMAILAGIGASYLVELYNRYSHYKHYKNYSLFFKIALILSFLPITLKLISLHPNESVYFNPIIGGLKGAKERNIPGWGNSLGSTYRQGIRWLNAHAEPNAKLATVYELLSNIPASDLRPDIQYSNAYRSGTKREGEYLIGVTHEGEFQAFYNFKYVQTYLIPVYEVSVEGVPLLQVWKNDDEHTKQGYLRSPYKIPAVWKKKHRNLVITVQKKAKITSLIIHYETDRCSLPQDGKVEISKDGLLWSELPGNLLLFPGFVWFKPQEVDGQLHYLFAAEELQKIRLTRNYPDSCLFRNPVSITLYGF